MKRIAPEVEIIDVTHGIQPQGVLQGALVLANTLPYLPEGVHLAVVDPGVGGTRPRAPLSRSSTRESAAIAARSRSGARTGACTSTPTTACSSRPRRSSAG